VSTLREEGSDEERTWEMREAVALMADSSCTGCGVWKMSPLHQQLV